MNKDKITHTKPLGKKLSPNKNDNISLDTDLELLEWYNAWVESNNDKFADLYFCESRYLILKGGGGSGKSIFAGRKLLERATTEYGHRFLVARKVANTLRESCFAQLIRQLNEYYPNVIYKANQSDLKITFPATKSEIIFSGLDDVEKLKSIANITGIWIEEASELLESDFNQLDIRLRGNTKYYKQIILSFNPISILHWLKLKFFDRPPENATISESTYLDNRFLDDAQKEVLESFKYSDGYYYQVYCLGEWGITGKTVFDAEAIAERLKVIPAPEECILDYDYDGNRISNIHIVPGGSLKIYKHPIQGHPYIIGGDTAGDGSDSCVLQVIDGNTGEQVATFKDAEVDEDVFTRQAFALGMYYNEALMAVESNYSTFPILELERLGYRNQYVRETFDNYTHKSKTAFGFQTNSKTRPVIISELIQFVRESCDLINDRDTLGEMLTFVRNEKTYKPEAEPGGHDDTIMALAIAYFARNSGQINLAVKTPQAAEVHWEADMWEDYYNASEEEKKILIEKWGRPKR